MGEATMEPATDADITESAPVAEEKTLYTDLLDAFKAAHEKHRDVDLADAILLVGSMMGSIIGASFERYGLLKVGFVRNVESAMHRAAFMRAPVAGNA
jgi:hypothetical protein